MPALPVAMEPRWCRPAILSCPNRLLVERRVFHYRDDMDLDALTFFHLVVTTGGFGRAARASGRPKATLSRRVADLEASLGLRLLERGSGSLRLTEEGRALLANTQDALADLAAAETQLRGRHAGLRGRLRVSVPLLLGTDAMGELAARFLALHPEVRLEVVAQDRYVDLIQEGYDVAIRVNPQADDELVGRCFLRDTLLLVAPPTLERPRCQVGSHPVPIPAIVRSIGEDAGPWVVDGPDRLVLQPDPVLRLSTLAIRDAVIAGAGVAILPSLHVRGHIASGRLASWGDLAAPPLEMWVLHASARHASGKVRAFVQFMLDAFADRPVPAPGR